MRAKTVNEDQHFERGKNPKTALGLGGVTLEKELGAKMDELEYEIAMSIKAVDDEWKEWLRKTFTGKTITARMSHHPSINKKTNQTNPGKGTKDFTIKVQDVLPSDDIGKMMDSKLYTNPIENQSIIVADMENNIYSIKVSEKIYIEE